MDEFKVPVLPLAATKAEKKPVKENEEQIHKTTKPNETDPTESFAERTPSAVCPYKTPSWSAPPENEDVTYKFEVLKSGQIIEEIEHLEKQANWKFGRSPEGNDVTMAHPTISRFHAVLQYRPHLEKQNDADKVEENNNPPEGWYIYDLGSTHGTFLNKQRIPPKVFIRMRVGHMLKLGASTRSYILQGPVEDEEPESELSITELREQREQKQREAVEAKRLAEEAEEERKKNEGVSWGMSEDANEETDLAHNPYASSNNEEYFATNPKMALRHFFDREDMPLEYKCDEMSIGSFVCRIELPVDDENGRPITAEVVHKGKKKDCVFQCALEACRILDRLGLLRQKNQEPLARRKKTGSDSDDDEFLDRTGDIARKKERKANAGTSTTLTYDDLLKQEKDVEAELQKIQLDINEYQTKQKRLKEQEKAQDEADLDSFMEHLKDDVSQLDKTEIKRLRLEEQRLKSEQQKLKRLIKIAKPYDLPFGKISSTANDSLATDSTSAVKKQMPLIGKRNQFSKFKVIKNVTKAPTTSKAYASDEEEMDDDDNDNEKNKTSETTETPQVKEEAEVKSKKLIEKEKTNEDLNSCEIETSPKDTTHTEITEKQPANEDTVTTPQNVTSVDEVNQVSTDNSRKRTRQRRVRGKRQDVDFEDLDEHESSEKYAKWVPPKNQTGDGFTALNEKFGY